MCVCFRVGAATQRPIRTFLGFWPDLSVESGARSVILWPVLHDRRRLRHEAWCKSPVHLFLSFDLGFISLHTGFPAPFTMTPGSSLVHSCSENNIHLVSQYFFNRHLYLQTSRRKLMPSFHLVLKVFKKLASCFTQLFSFFCCQRPFKCNSMLYREQKYIWHY